MTTTTANRRTCDEQGCPFPEESRCLDGFDPIKACPHISDGTAPEDDDEAGHASPASPDSFGDAVDGEPGPAGEGSLDGTLYPISQGEPAGAGGTAPPDTMTDVGGNGAFDLDDVDEFLQREPGSVVLIAGPIESGKTTLIVELYARFLRGPFAGASFGGSETLRALGSRHFPALAKSGAAEPTTRRTSDEDMRLLHLHLSVDGYTHHLLFTDVRGEYFENIIDGGAPAREISIAPRADRCLIVIDGERAADRRQHDVVFTEARQLTGGLRADGGLAPTTPAAVLCTKWDKVSDERREKVRAEARQIAEFAAAPGSAPALFTTTVRSGAPDADFAGLAEVLGWLTTAGRSNPEDADSPPSTTSGGRSFWKEPGSR